MPIYKKILIGIGVCIGILLVFFVLTRTSNYTSGLKRPIQEKLADARVEKDAKSSISLFNQVSSTNSGSNNLSSKDVVLDKTYHNSKFKYQIDYPADWKFIQNNGNVVFNGKEGTPSAQSSFLISVSRQEHKHLSAQQILDVIKIKILKSTSNMKIIEAGVMPALYPNAEYDGRYAIYSYTINNTPFMHLEVAAIWGLNHYLYVLDYIAPASQFKADLPIAKAMIISFASQK